ncbi:metallophosphoesterase [Paracoccus limosus]|uniref:metallophosphoesterase n=1 Tax=Paracoccus limosus TaxID=913252 RepID=UPI001478726A
MVLPGDLTDDGQPGAYDAFARIVAPHAAAGMRFYATFGNHDAFGPTRRSLGKRLTAGAGQPVRLRRQVGLSTPEALMRLGDHGLMPPAGTSLWETPFGRDPDPARRRDAMGLIDASYLTEPCPGLWLLMLDANIFARRGARWSLQADGAWDHALAARPYLERWTGDCVARARQAGKAIVAVSHYPMVASAPPAILPPAERLRWAQRMPLAATAQRLAATGITLHVNGHMHAPAESRCQGLRNVTLPSPVAAPGGYAIIGVEQGAAVIAHIPQPPTPDFDLARDVYAAAPEAAALWQGVRTYGDFLDLCLAQRFR